ncbi:BspA family leucine-rich repeat surface protein [Chryseobacterium sp. 2TAF14]|uniref:BspA family leucine-rich repeat surface protein n=1 Tax=Chryseobacterium sp. 2TAF14 TaxID=3233007 RepID=UPI003F93A9D5
MICRFTFLFIFIFSQLAKSQTEFITIWKPSGINPSIITNVTAPSVSSSNQIWFPGAGANYTIQWEEINFPQHNATLTNVSSAGQILIDFGTPLNPSPNQATYRLKVSNGNGVFNKIQFASFILDQTGAKIWSHFGNSDKILAISQWGNIQWSSMFSAFSHCQNLQLIATDSPDLSNVANTSHMFFNTSNFSGNSSMANWDTSFVKDFSFMFAHTNIHQFTETFNPPIGNWNTSAATNFNSLFENRKIFNQNLNSWNTSNVTTMNSVFAGCNTFNQPLDNWNTSNVTDMSLMFHLIPNFNQPLNSWDTSNVTNVSHMFHNCTSFNQPLDNWDTSNLTDMNIFLQGATAFNQSLASWNLPALTTALLAITQTAIDCANYSDTISGWADNPNTANNINLGPVNNLTYSINIINKRNILINKGWLFTGDVAGECEKLAVSESNLKNSIYIYPNPASDFIYLNHFKDVKSYTITDFSGRIIMKDSLTKDFINIKSLTSGNYILQIATKEKTQSFKFTKK